MRELIVELYCSDVIQKLQEYYEFILMFDYNI